MTPTLIVILGIIVLALTFDFFNGFHDAANSVATVVTTRVLSPMQAVVWAAFFNFVAARGRYLCGPRWSGRSDRLGRHHLAHGFADKLFACAHQWICRGCDC